MKSDENTPRGLMQVALLLCIFAQGTAAYTGVCPGCTQSEILNLPSGSRQIAMGDVGVATSYDEMSLFWNPALLGQRNVRWQTGALSYQFEKPFPSSLWTKNRHHSAVFAFQPADRNAGTFALSISHHNRGAVTWIDNLGRTVASGNTWEACYGVTWGFGFQELGLENHLWGVSAKYVVSAVYPGSSKDGVGSAGVLAWDVGYVWLLSDEFTLGISLLNMGAALFHLSQDHAEPLPFEGNLALGYTKAFSFSEWILNELTLEYRLSRYFVTIHPDSDPDPFYRALITSWQVNSAEGNWRSLQHRLGYEVTTLKHLRLRQGVSIDPRYEEAEMHWGFGVRFLDHLSADFHHIYSPGSAPYRHGQWGLTLSVYRLWGWNRR